MIKHTMGISAAVFALVICFVAMPVAVMGSVNYTLNGTDVTGDVFSGSSVVGGYLELDITYAETAESGSNILLKVVVVGNILDSNNVSYAFTISLGNSNTAVVYYINGNATYTVTPTIQYGSCQYTKSGGTLTVVVPKTIFGEPAGWAVTVTTGESASECGDVLILTSGGNVNVAPGIGGKGFIPGFEVNVAIIALAVMAMMLMLARCISN